MHNRIMSSFHKNLDCPSSQELLAFENGAASASAATVLSEHIRACDFCGAEAEFYSHFPHTTDDRIKVADIPDHLFQLAEALLTNRENGNRLLATLVKENESFAR